MFVKNPNWKQKTPADQLVAIRMSLEGHADNYWDGWVISAQQFKEYLLDHLEQIKNLEPFLQNKAKW